MGLCEVRVSRYSIDWNRLVRVDPTRDLTAATYRMKSRNDDKGHSTMR